jgi:hypothetical protein
LIRPLEAKAAQTDTISLSGTFGVFYSGHLVARLYDEHGHLAAVTPVADVNPNERVSLETTIPSPAKCSRVSLHLIDNGGVDRGALQEIQLSSRDNH